MLRKRALRPGVKGVERANPPNETAKITAEHDNTDGACSSGVRRSVRGCPTLSESAEGESAASDEKNAAVANLRAVSVT